MPVVRYTKDGREALMSEEIFARMEAAGKVERIRRGQAPEKKKTEKQPAGRPKSKFAPAVPSGSDTEGQG